MERLVLDVFALAIVLVTQFVARRAARARALRERGDFLAERINEVNQRRLLFRPGE